MSEQPESNFGVWLARIEGKLDLSSLRHEQTDAWKVTVDQRLHRHSNDISGLQALNHLREGERKGLTISGRIMWAAISFVAGSGGVFALLEVMK